MSTSPTFNTVTAKSINLANPGSMSAAGTVIARDITATGNIVANNGAARRASFSQVTATGNVTGANFITLGVVNAVTQIRSSQIIANNSMSIGSTTTIQNSGVTTANLIATGNVTGNNLFTAGRVSAAGNVSGNYILGNGYFLTGLAGGGGTYGNSNVAQYLPTYTGALTGGNLTVGSSTLINNNLSLQNIVAAANITAGRINSGTMSLSGNVLSPLTVSGNVTGTNLNTTGQMSATGNVQGGNLRTVGTVSATGNITGNYIFGNGAFLTGIANGGGSGSYGNANVAAYLPTYTGNLNPTNLSASGSVSAANLAIGSSTLTANSLSVPLDVVAGRNVTGSGLRGATMSLSGNVLSPLTVSGNVTGTNLNTTGRVSATGNVQGDNVVAIGMVSAIGNITGNYIFGNGAFLTGIANGGGSDYGNANVAAYLPTYAGTLNPASLSTTGAVTAASLQIGSSTLTANSLSVPLDVVAGRNVTGSGLRGATMSLSGNVISALNVSANMAAVNVNTTGQMSATGNVQGDNVVAIGMVSAIGNITGNYIFGNGAFLTGIANGGGGSTYGNANVAAYLPTYTGTLTGANLIIGTSTLTANSLSVPLDVVAGRNINGANLFGTIRTASQTGITQVGTLGTLAVAGEIQAGSMALAGALSATGAITGTTITGTGLSVSGSGIIGTVQILNSAITGAASVTATGNVSGGALRSSGIVSAVGAITGASVSASGNVTGLNILGNGYSLSNILRSNQARTVWVSNASPSSLSGASGDIWYQTYS